MPKIIQNVKEQIIQEAKRQVIEQGYQNTTIRSVASGCGIAVGTVYNYFKSKDVLIASFILQDWLICVDTVRTYPKESTKDYLSFIYTSLIRFSKKYDPIFSDCEAEKAFSQFFSERHKQIRDQLANLILPITSDLFTAEYVAEALLCWTVAGKSFEDIYELLPEKIK